MVKLKTTNAKDSSMLVTMKDLGEFTEQVILPGVETIVDEKIGDLRGEMKAGFTDLRSEMQKGFDNVGKSIRVLAGEIIENNEAQREFNEKQLDINHKVEARLSRVENKLEIRR